MSVRKEYAIVTGGSSGMGLEYVEILASMGYNVVIVALFQNETDEVRDRMSQKYPGQDFLSFGMDLSAADAPSRLFEGIRNVRPDAIVAALRPVQLLGLVDLRWKPHRDSPGLRRYLGHRCGVTPDPGGGGL